MIGHLMWKAMWRALHGDQRSLPISSSAHQMRRQLVVSILRASIAAPTQQSLRLTVPWRPRPSAVKIPAEWR